MKSQNMEMIVLVCIMVVVIIVLGIGAYIFAGASEEVDFCLEQGFKTVSKDNVTEGYIKCCKNIPNYDIHFDNLYCELFEKEV